MMRSPIITDTGIWDVKTWGYMERDDLDLPTITEVRTQDGLAAFLQRGYDAGQKLRESAKEAGYVLLEAPAFHILTEPLYERNTPRIVCEARVISREAGITSIRDDRPRHRAATR